MIKNYFEILTDAEPSVVHVALEERGLIFQDVPPSGLMRIYLQDNLPVSFETGISLRDYGRFFSNKIQNPKTRISFADENVYSILGIIKPSKGIMNRASILASNIFEDLTENHYQAHLYKARVLQKGLFFHTIDLTDIKRRLKQQA